LRTVVGLVPGVGAVGALALGTRAK
jgi:hypothetical protein